MPKYRLNKVCYNEFSRVLQIFTVQAQAGFTTINKAYIVTLIDPVNKYGKY